MPRTNRVMVANVGGEGAKFPLASSSTQPPGCNRSFTCWTHPLTERLPRSRMTSLIPGGTFLNLPGLCDLMAPLDVGAVTQKAMEQAHRAGLPDIATIVTNVEKRRNGDW